MKKLRIGKHELMWRKVRKGRVESPGRPRAKFDLELAKKLKASGYSYRAIAKELGVSSSTVFKYANDLDK